MPKHIFTRKHKALLNAIGIACRPAENFEKLSVE